jgi:hypothetical protein
MMALETTTYIRPGNSGGTWDDRSQKQIRIGRKFPVNLVKNPPPAHNLEQDIPGDIRS